MCGIVGYIGDRDVVEVLLSGLGNLEYRGYDSAGVALNDENQIKIFKSLGKLKVLRENLEAHKSELKAPKSGIGHTRWATHGTPTTNNAHPHTCNCGSLALVHNGIVENYKELKEELIQKGCIFKSQTDTEVVAHLVAHEFAKTHKLEDALRNATKKLTGAYALCVMHKDEPDKIVGVRKNAPMIIGLGDGENFISSDVPAIIEYTKKTIYIDDDEIAVITKNSVKIYDKDGREIQKKVEMLPWEPVALSKLGYKHFMLKEIYEQSDVVRNVINGKIFDINEPVRLPEVNLTQENLKTLSRVKIIACGTSLHAAMVGKYIIEDFTGIPVDIEASSEYIYRKSNTDASTLVIGVSQSGETTDTITAIKQAKSTGSHILIITNRPDSNMARLADSLLSVNAGIEVSVAATKSYTAQLVSFYLLALHLAEIKGSMEKSKIESIKHDLIILPSKIEALLSDTKTIKDCAKKYSGYKNFIYIARGINLATAYEGALKLKEISYINATGYPAGELKHGPIAMLDETMPVLAVLMPGSIVYEKIFSNCEEAKARNAKLIALTSEDTPAIRSLFDDVLIVPKVHEFLSPILTCIPLQLLAYYIAEFLGKDVDQPRNLAKSVTVE
ncbi:glutamine--fructose-6-phosphate transaminase (isomerizing) [bacterium]|nr:glutamine--fructose-6-phosphate transaminase (isomerizing) [bacterium]